MGAGASSGTGPAPLAAARGGGGGSSTTINTVGRNGSTGQPGNGDQVTRASNGSIDYPSKQGRHVIIQADEPKTSMPKGSKGGLMDKIRSFASQNNSPAQSAANSRMGSRAGSVAGAESDKSQMSTRASRRDEYDVDSDDEDLEGFIYDDDSTSEDEREDYVNAFSRRKKLPKGDDYSEYEGAAVRSLTAGARTALKSAARRRSRSTSGDEEGDDEWDPEEDKIRALRQQKRQQERAKAAALAAQAAGAAGTGQAVGVAGGREAGPGPPRLADPAAASASSPQQQQQQQQQPAPSHRLTPQPPTEPPVRNSAGRRSAGGGASQNGSYSPAAASGASGPGPGPGPVSVPGPALGQAPGSKSVPAPAGRGAPLRGAAPPPPAMNLGASASSQYWQAKRSQADMEGTDGPEGGQGLSRLEQLAALQKKRQQDQAREAESPQRRGGVRWQTSDEVPSPSPAEQQRVSVAQEARLTLPAGAERQASLPESTYSCEPITVPVQKSTSLNGYMLPQALQAAGPSPVVAPPPQPAPPQHERSRPPSSRSKELEGTSFIKHLAPPRQRSKPGFSLAPAEPAPSASAAMPHPPLQPHASDVTDFDVDEVLSSLAPGDASAVQQWAGGRPQPPPVAQPQPQQQAGGLVPQHKRSIRAVKSDFVSMRVDNAPESGTDLTARVLSLPVAAPRPSGNGGGPTVSTAPAVLTSTSTASAAAPAPVSRFARMGASMVGPNSGPVPQSDGTMGSASPSAAWGGAAAGTGAKGSQPAAATVPPNVTVPLPAGSPARRPRRCSNHSSDGTPSPMKVSLSGRAVDGAASGASSGGGTPVLQRIASVRPCVSPRVSGAGNDISLVLPAIRPGSGSSGGGGPRGSDNGGPNSILNAAALSSTLGRSRFGNARHQNLQQEVVRGSAAVTATQRDYDSDSALSRPAGAGPRASWNGGNGGVGNPLAGGSIMAAGPGPGMSMGTAALGPAARSRLGQVGA